MCFASAAVDKGGDNALAGRDLIAVSNLDLGIRRDRRSSDHHACGIPVPRVNATPARLDDEMHQGDGRVVDLDPSSRAPTDHNC